MNELEKSRVEIDKIDREMAQLFEKRMKVCASIADYKKEHALPIFDPAREQKILSRHASLVEDPVYREYYMEFVNNVMGLAKKYQSRLNDGMRVAYSGAEGAFGYLAAKKMFPEANLTAFSDFESAYRAVENGEFDCAVLPFENSYAGDVGNVMDLMFTGSLYVNGTVELDVVQNLIALPGVTTDKIKTVVSHPQALEQCEDFIKSRGLEVVTYSNTALAAKYVSELGDESVAAIASEDAANNCGLQVIERGINTGRSNTTRFAVFSRAQHTPSTTLVSEKEHFILMFTVKNEAGSLAQTLNIIGAHNFNMRSVRSRPMKDLLWSYYFYIEAEGNVGSRDGQDMLRELSAICAHLKLVGTYN